MTSGSEDHIEAVVNGKQEENDTGDNQNIGEEIGNKRAKAGTDSLGVGGGVEESVGDRKGKKGIFHSGFKGS